MLRTTFIFALFATILMSATACSKKKKELEPQAIVPAQKIAQKVTPLEPTFKPKGPVQPKMGAPITIPPI